MKLLQTAKELRRELILNVYKENQKSIRFYEKAGFWFVKEQEDKNTSHLEIVMRWP